MDVARRSPVWEAISDLWRDAELQDHELDRFALHFPLRFRLGSPIMRKLGPALAALLSLATSSAAAVGQDSELGEDGDPRPTFGVEPWSDNDPPDPPVRHEFGDFGARFGAEYRAQFLFVNPISLNTEGDPELSWLEHRLRLDTTLDYKDKVRIVASADLLDGVLWGDNGELGADPAPNSGTNITTRSPNVTAPCVGYRAGDPLDSGSYGYGLCNREQFIVRRAYGEVLTPVGLLRIGRQPVSLGTGVQSATGDGRPNRFGMSRIGNSADRILFATKPLEAFKADEERDPSEENGLFLIGGYDHLVNDAPAGLSDDVRQGFASVRLHERDYPLGQDLVLGAYYVHRFDDQYDTAINTIGLRAMSRFGDVHAGFDVAANLGSTREVAEAYSVVTRDPIVDQTVRQIAARAAVRYDHPWFTLYLEADYASGDDEPEARTPLTQFVFAEDANVGLLLFEHVLAFQTARASGASVEILRRLGASSYPAENVNTRGAFTNAIAIFPQADLRSHRDVLLRGGVLMAWAAEKVVDPTASLLNRDGNTIDDDLVNFVGGKPAYYYGTEIDARVQWRFMDHFIFDLEGAILFPGAALQDENEAAVRSVLVQARTTFYL